MPTLSPTPTTPPPPALLGVGRLLYLGSLDDTEGIISSAADGQDRRVIAAGKYLEIAWAPDGRRFAALTALTQLAVLNRIPDTLDLFAADGRLLRRFEFGPSGAIFLSIAWSPDSQRVAVSASSAPAGFASVNRELAAWILDERGAIGVAPGVSTWVQGWSPDGRLTMRVTEPRATASAVSPQGEAIWTADAAGGDLRKLAPNGHYPLGWSPDGATLFALGDLRAVVPEFRASIDLGWLTLVAIDSASGTRRVLASADGSTPPGAVPTNPTHWFQTPGSVSPRGDHLALWAWPIPQARGTPEPEMPSLAVFSAAGERVWTDRGLGQRYLPIPIWAPDGGRLAYIAAQGTLKIVAFNATPPTGMTLGTAVPDYAWLQWSPDGRWLAFNRTGQGLIIADSTAQTGAAALDATGRWPSWYR